MKKEVESCLYSLRAHLHGKRMILVLGSSLKAHLVYLQNRGSRNHLSFGLHAKKIARFFSFKSISAMHVLVDASWLFVTPGPSQVSRWWVGKLSLLRPFTWK